MDTFMMIVVVTEVLRCLAALLVLYYAYRIYQGQKELIRSLGGSKKGSLEKAMESSATSTLKTTPEK